SEIRVLGIASRLVNNLSTQATLRLLTDVNHNTTLTTDDGSVNAGRIILDSTRSDRTSQIVTGSAFTNRSTGLIQSVNNGGGNRQVTGNLINEGRIEGSAYFLSVFGTYEQAGGTVDGGVSFWNTNLKITASPSQPTTLRLFG